MTSVVRVLWKRKLFLTATLLPKTAEEAIASVKRLGRHVELWASPEAARLGVKIPQECDEKQKEEL